MNSDLNVGKHSVTWVVLRRMIPKKGKCTIQTTVIDIIVLRNFQLSNAFKFFKQIYRIKFNLLIPSKKTVSSSYDYQILSKLNCCHFPLWLCSRHCLGDPTPTSHGLLPGGDHLTQLWPIKCQREQN